MTQRTRPRRAAAPSTVNRWQRELKWLIKYLQRLDRRMDRAQRRG